MRIVYAPRALVLGEPLFVVVRIKNTSSQTLFLRKDDSLTASLFHQKNGEKVKCSVPLHQIIPPDKLPFSPIKPGWSKVLSYSFLNCNLTADVYTLSIQYTYTYKKGNGRPIFQRIAKNVRLTISYPSGVDEDAYKRTNGCPMCKKEWVLKHYPTSTYAGWVLAYTRFGNNWIPGDWRADYLEDFYRSDKEKKYVTRSTIIGYKKDGEPIFKDLREEAKEYIERGEQFLLVHPNHPMKLRILGQMAWAYCTVHDWQRAYETTKKFLQFLNEAVRTRSYIPKDVRGWQPFFEGLIQELRRRHLVK